MNEMPLVLAITQPTTAARLIAAPASMISRPARWSANTPHPSCAMARIVKVITAWRCSLCTPIAAAWIAPAPIDAIAATATAGANVDVPARMRDRAKISGETAVITPPRTGEPVSGCTRIVAWRYPRARSA